MAASTAIESVFDVKSFIEKYQETKGRISGPKGAAFRLGMPRTTLMGRMRRLGIDAREIRSSFPREGQVA